MTRADHVSGSDRVFEAVNQVDPEGDFEIILNLQGDLPTLDAATWRATAWRPLQDKGPHIATIAAEITDAEERTNPNVVKVVGTPTGGARPAAGALLHARHRALRRGAALPSHRHLRLPPLRARAVRVAAAVAAGEARAARAAARAGGRHAHRRDDR